MKIKKLLIANRGEIAIRIARAAFELGMTTVALFSEDDATSLHCRKTDEACALKGSGAAAYLDIEQILSIACATGCDAIHPGYGFVSENAQFAARCAEQDIIFVGPTAESAEIVWRQGPSAQSSATNPSPRGARHPRCHEFVGSTRILCLAW